MNNTQLTWENLDEVNYSDDYEKFANLCKSSKPSDFYFHLAINKDEPDFVDISIVPKSYFRKHHHCVDDNVNLDHILPDDVEELMESAWSSDRPIEDLRKDFLERGFEENKEYSNFINEFNEEDEEDFDDEAEEENDGLTHIAIVMNNTQLSWENVDNFYGEEYKKL
jgi:hypothetical protein